MSGRRERQIRSRERRPDLGSARQAERLYRHRYPLYQAAADITIDIRNKTFEQVALESGRLLWEKGLLLHTKTTSSRTRRT